MKKLFYSIVTLSVILNILLVVMLVFYPVPPPPAVHALYIGFFTATFEDGDEGLCVAAEDIGLFKKWLYEINETYY